MKKDNEEFNSKKFKQQKHERRACRSFRQNWAHESLDYFFEENEEDVKIVDELVAKATKNWKTKKLIT